MKTFGAGLLLVGLCAVVGCTTKGTGASTGSTARSEKLTLTGPTEPTTALLGTHKQVEVTVNRPANFKKDVTLTAEVKGNAKNVAAHLSRTVIKADDTNNKVTLSFETKEEATAGAYKVGVRAMAADEEPVQIEVRFTIPGR